MSWIKRALRVLGFHVHEWGVWKSYSSIQRVSDNSKIGEVFIRQCATCKIVSSRKIWLI